jgi:shikimate dehydrogenase
MSLSGSARLAGVVGWPVSQSLSPALHGHWLGEHGIDGAYIPLPVQPSDFATVLDGLRRAGFRGLNVTLPHKEAAFALAHRHDEAARITGAVNLLVFGEHGIEGRNADVAGLAAALVDALGPDPVKGRPVAIWGAGGAARGAIYALAQMGAAEIRLFNRTPARAQSLAAALSPQVSASVTAAGYEAWPQACRDVALVVHTTSAGMKKAPSLDLPLDGLPAGAAVFDAVYNPLETGLLARARARGLKTVDGLGMLMHQAVPAFEAFYGVRPAVTPELRRKLEAMLHA